MLLNMIASPGEVWEQVSEVHVRELTTGPW
jgi:hypothetical protein